MIMALLCGSSSTGKMNTTLKKVSAPCALLENRFFEQVHTITLLGPSLAHRLVFFPTGWWLNQLRAPPDCAGFGFCTADFVRAEWLSLPMPLLRRRASIEISSLCVCFVMYIVFVLYSVYKHTNVLTPLGIIFNCGLSVGRSEIYLHKA